MNDNIAVYTVSLILTFIITVLIERKLIPALLSKKMGQKILEIGPRWHKNKEGTPTMGGLGFIFAMTAVVAAAIILRLCGVIDFELLPMLVTYGYALSNGLIGFIDDRAKFSHGRNDGLTPKQKFLLQLAAAALYIAALAVWGGLETALYIPYFDVTLELGIVYYVFALILLTGMVNSVNLTDGIDGLASSVTFVVAVFFSAVGFALANSGLLLLSAVTVGGCLGFLVYNFHPAKVFMGDTGSLFLGGMVCGFAFIIGNPLIVVAAGIIYIAETVSDIIQVSVYKLTKKRVFKMAPIHHHFEMLGWSEVKIVSVFSLVTALFCGIAWFGIK